MAARSPGPVAITVALIPFRSSLGLAGALLCILLAVFASALAGGIYPAAAATVIGFLAADFFFTVPYYSLRIDRAIDVAGLIVFASVAAATGLLVDILTRRGIQSAHSQAEADGLARLAAEALALGPGTRPEMAIALRRTFDLDAVAVFRRRRPRLADGSGSGRAAARHARPGAVPGRAHRRGHPGPGRQQAHRAGRAAAPGVHHRTAARPGTKTTRPHQPPPRRPAHQRRGPARAAAVT